MQEPGAAQEWVGLAQLDQAADEARERLVLRRHIASQLSSVVLAVGVVVAPLAAAELVAHEQHRHALGEEQGGEQAAPATVAQAADRRLVGRAPRRRHCC